ncbi:glutamate dehydrogenase [Kitasatospora sp. NPDC008115]|uniref:terpene synthase family protein n=1 Tax=Kitasatospora sp. NPDC008115 TaxID=3364022 RepID=UPI0036E08ACD
MGAALDILPFYCPVPPAIHPEVDAVERRAHAWLDRTGLCPTTASRAWTAGTNSAEFYARFAPDADPDRLWIAVCWIYWGFAFDDARCDEGPLAADPAGFAALAGTVQRALELPGSLDTDDPYAAALHDIGERFRACAGPVQNRRFQQAHRAWLSGVQWQIGNRAAGHMPDLDAYLSMRLHSAGGEPTYAMLEIANGIDVPAAEMDSPAVCALTEMAILVAALDNDRHSHAKEAGRGQTDQNIFAVLTARHTLAPRQALHEAVALRDAVLDRFLALRDEVSRRAGADLRRYLDDLGHGIRGNIEWGLRVPRYLSLRDAASGPGTTTAPDRLPWAERPLTGTLDVRRLPTISWWWQDLAR